MVRMDENMPFLLQYEHVAWYDNGKVRILDRRVYPTEVRFVECVTYQEVVQAIADMVTQSAGPYTACLLYTSPSPRDGLLSRMPSSA